MGSKGRSCGSAASRRRCCSHKALRPASANRTVQPRAITSRTQCDIGCDLRAIDIHRRNLRPTWRRTREARCGRSVSASALTKEKVVLNGGQPRAQQAASIWGRPMSDFHPSQTDGRSQESCFSGICPSRMR